MPDGQILFQSPQPGQGINGVGIAQILGLDAVHATDIGYWFPLAPFGANASVENTSTGSWTATTVELLVSNAPQMPANGWTTTITGSLATDDILTVTLTSPQFSQGVITASYKLLSTDTTTTLAATGLANALIAAIKAASGVVVPGQFPNIADSDIYTTIDQQQQAAAGALTVLQSTDTVTIYWNMPWLILPSIAASTTGAESMTITRYNDGQGFTVGTYTGAGNTVINQPAMWAKIACTVYNSTSGKVTSILTGVIP